MKPTNKTSLASLPEEVLDHIQHLERIRQDFVANVSHELRTPLTVMHGYLETLLDQPSLEPDKKKIFSQMYEQTSRMENLINGLLLLSRLEDHERAVKTDKVLVAELLTQIVEEARVLSGDLQHDISLEVDKKLFLKGNQEDLRSLFSNLIFNAVRYTPAKGKITIQWHKENNQAYLHVKDTGIGIAKEHLPRITERFYRVDRARSRASGGTGLGLAIVKHILINHQGKLEISSKLGKGSEFVCIFPLDE